MNKHKKVAVIGGGAAGFFAALSVAEHHPTAEITLFEKMANVLAKVRISGGGRCNVTHNCDSIPDLIKAYPRGGRSLKSIFHQFKPKDTVAWFKNKNVSLKTEKDGRIFPVSDDSQTIIDCLEKACAEANINIKRSSAVQKLMAKNEQWVLHFTKGEVIADQVIITTGGSPKLKGFDWLSELGHSIIPPVPSLFTFNMPNEPITKLMGLVAEKAKVRIMGTKIRTEGPLLITHWGMSGPAILKASSFGARTLANLNYSFTIQIQWLSESIEEIDLLLATTLEQHPHKKAISINPLPIPNRLWIYLLEKINLPKDRRWNEIGQKNLHRIVNLLTNDQYKVEGKTTFKEEFVTCGGVNLKEINLNTMESMKNKGLYFAGEVLDIDAITGGYNFQVAWSGGYLAGQLK